MDPAFMEFIKLIEAGGNVAILLAAYFLYRVIHSLARIEAFMATLFEVLLRTDGIKLRDSDAELLKEMRSDMRSKNRQGGFIMKRLLLFILGAVLFGAFMHSALAQVAPDAVKATWVNATQDVNGNALPDPPHAKSLRTTRIHRKFADDCETNFGPVSEVTEVINVTPDVTMVLFENMPAGKHCVRLRHITLDGTFSDWTPVKFKITQTPTPELDKPGPPTLTLE